MCSLHVKWVHLCLVGLLCLGGPLCLRPPIPQLAHNYNYFLWLQDCSWATGLGIATVKYSLHRLNGFFCGALPSTLASDVIVVND